MICTKSDGSVCKHGYLLRCSSCATFWCQGRWAGSSSHLRPTVLISWGSGCAYREWPRTLRKPQARSSKCVAPVPHSPHPHFYPPIDHGTLSCQARCVFRFLLNTVLQTTTANQSGLDWIERICPPFHRFNLKWNSEILPFWENLFFKMCIRVYN